MARSGNFVDLLDVSPCPKMPRSGRQNNLPQQNYDVGAGSVVSDCVSVRHESQVGRDLLD